MQGNCVLYVIIRSNRLILISRRFFPSLDDRKISIGGFSRSRSLCSRSELFTRILVCVTSTNSTTNLGRTRKDSSNFNIFLGKKWSNRCFSWSEKSRTNLKLRIEEFNGFYRSKIVTVCIDKVTSKSCNNSNTYLLLFEIPRSFVHSIIYIFVEKLHNIIINLLIFLSLFFHLPLIKPNILTSNKHRLFPKRKGILLYLACDKTSFSKTLPSALTL